MAYLIRKTSRRATAGGRIEDNWVELPTPELAIATSTPAFPILGGRLGAHFGRMGVALSSAVPHGISNANGLLHSQTIRRGSISEITNIWPGFLASERREPRTHSALALVNNVVSVFAFAPNPGSPPSSPASLHIQQSAPPKSSWLTVFPEEHTTEPSRVEQVEYDTDQRDPEPQQENAVEFPNSPARPFDPLHQQRSMTCPVPSIHNRDSAYGFAQYITMGPQPLFDSPVPLTSGTNTRRDAETVDEYTAATSKDIIEGLGGLCSILDCQPGEDWHSASTSFAGPRPMTETQDFPTSIHQDSTSSYYTPMSNVFSRQQPTPASFCDRKLLIIGSSYACRTASNFAYQSGLGTLDATLYDTKSIKSVFRRRAYSIETLVGEDFNRDVLLQRVANFLRPAKRGDVRAIVLTGHGRRMVNGKAAIVPPICRGEEDLIPADLWDQTISENTEAGVILLSIFATCMSGAFMHQRVNFNDLSNPLPSRATIPPDAPIFVTFASSQSDQSTYESTVELSEDGTEGRLGDHFLRAFTLAAREPNITDWQSFIDKLEEHFARMRQMGDLCAKQSGDHDMNESSSGSDTSWSEHAPQQPEYSVSQLHLPLFESVFPSEISLIERPTTPLDNPTNIAEEFLAHIAIRGDFPEITHYTMSSTRSDVVPPV